MPVTIALYNCEGCVHRDDCPDYSEHRRFASRGVTLIEGPGSVRCHFGQHDRRKDYSVDLPPGARLREFLSGFGFVDIGNDNDDVCFNVCHTCAHYGCPIHPKHSHDDGSAYFQSLYAGRRMHDLLRKVFGL